ncbi:aldehyde dehydrogenase family protein [Streptomyces sp. BK340]|uniref:aldehyde dehydrogenase family protein n=1 Tax=Streptomyces sp. BK340 TaxID=2572903 RepID=UPI0011A6B644|nr:aldehyde dehydrogenase family protein [Streptomyces sp. BK340]TVZ76748.1 acyl-CoA reductase-like NAD-dependent aldehyde dehydrogenase [Streptomyces sp. BK340]
MITQVFNPFNQDLVGTVPDMDTRGVEALLERARTGAKAGRAMPRHQRAAILESAAGLVGERAEEFARLIVEEAGKTIRQARKEVSRCVNTLKLSAHEAIRNAGEVIPFDAFPGSENRQGWFTREPLGIIAAITPYNDPLNLVAHKLGPAVAAGNAVILKPSDLAPLSAIELVDTLIEAGLPAEVITVATGGAELGEAIVSAPDVRMVSFTGGFVTGESIARTAGLKKLAMDLGGNAPVIVMADSDIEDAIESCVSGAFWAAGQNCVGTQRILVESAVMDRFREGFIKATLLLAVGDPLDEATDVGPMITEDHAERAHAMVEAACAAGADLLCGNVRVGSLYHPTVLENVPETSALWSDEAFAPVVVLQEFSDLEEAVSMANHTEYSLHAGVFTSNLDLALAVSERIDASGVMVNDSSDYRFDGMPFGGFKYGSMGREGVRFAYEEMTQPKVLCIRRQ